MSVVASIFRDITFDLRLCRYSGDKEGNPKTTSKKDLQLSQTFPYHGCPARMLRQFASWHAQLCLHLFLVLEPESGVPFETILKIPWVCAPLGSAITNLFCSVAGVYLIGGRTF